MKAAAIVSALLEGFFGWPHYMRPPYYQCKKCGHKERADGTGNMYTEAYGYCPRCGAAAGGLRKAGLTPFCKLMKLVKKDKRYPNG